MSRETFEYGNIPPQGWNHIVIDQSGNQQPYVDYIKKITKSLRIHDEKTRNKNRQELPYSNFLDRHMWFWKEQKDKFSDKQAKLYNTIMLIYIENAILQHLEGEIGTYKDINFYESLKKAIDNISFIGINQSDLARFLDTTQSDISQHFKALVKKGFIKESSNNGSKKFFILCDPDFIGYYFMRSYIS